MKEIKFRGMNKVTKEWVYGYYVVLEEETSELVECIWQLGAKRGTPIIPSTVGQFTGLLDINNNEIYEGDVIKAPTDFGPAGFEERLHVVKYDYEQGYVWSYVLIERIEIIGNIHGERDKY